jgi:hypothetical protein
VAQVMTNKFCHKIEYVQPEKKTMSKLIMNTSVMGIQYLGVHYYCGKTEIIKEMHFIGEQTQRTT